MKISVIMPTYNDSKTIKETLDSLMYQTYKDWELIIIDDGSTDNTRLIIEDYKKEKDAEDKIRYCYQENSDQLNAIINALDYITGDYIYVLHSDDLLNENTTFEKCVDYMSKNADYDAIISDLKLINDNGAELGIQKVRQYKNSKSDLPLQQLSLGRNLYVDVGFFKKESYVSSIKNTYLIWNMPFWINTENEKPSIIKVKKVDFIFMKYRIHENNYINDEIGTLNVLNGELRTLTTLMNYYNIPFYKLQNFLCRALHKMKIEYKPIYHKKEQKRKGKIVEFVVKKRVPNYKNNLFLNSLVNFYKNTSSSNRKVTIEKVPDIFIYKGKDIRKFNKEIKQGTIDEFYLNLLIEMEIGFKTIVVKNEYDKDKMIEICKFLCIFPEIEIL